MYKRQRYPFGGFYLELLPEAERKELESMPEEVLLPESKITTGLPDTIDVYKRQLPDSDRPEIVFSGRSNVGKSSLINKLCNRRKLARVSATPGKTATINFYKVDKAYFCLLYTSRCV